MIKYQPDKTFNLLLLNKLLLIVGCKTSLFWQFTSLNNLLFPPKFLFFIVGKFSFYSQKQHSTNRSASQQTRFAIYMCFKPDIATTKDKKYNMFR